MRTRAREGIHGRSPRNLNKWRWRMVYRTTSHPGPSRKIPSLHMFGNNTKMAVACGFQILCSDRDPPPVQPISRLEGRQSMTPAEGPLVPVASEAQDGSSQVTACAPFTIVGIGSSAGGLAAFTKLLQPLTIDSGMAFVFVQHLDPRHASQLVEILAKGTALPVIEVCEGMAILPNHLYVIPPNVNMADDAESDRAEGMSGSAVLDPGRALRPAEGCPDQCHELLPRSGGVQCAEDHDLLAADGRSSAERTPCGSGWWPAPRGRRSIPSRSSSSSSSATPCSVPPSRSSPPTSARAPWSRGPHGGLSDQHRVGGAARTAGHLLQQGQGRLPPQQVDPRHVRIRAA